MGSMWVTQTLLVSIGPSLGLKVWMCLCVFLGEPVCGVGRKVSLVLGLNSSQIVLHCLLHLQGGVGVECSNPWGKVCGHQELCWVWPCVSECMGGARELYCLGSVTVPESFLRVASAPRMWLLMCLAAPRNVTMAPAFLFPFCTFPDS